MPIKLGNFTLDRGQNQLPDYLNRNSMKLKLILTILFALLSVHHLHADNQEAIQPNIILILADDLGFGDLGCFGQRTLETPNIDRLAEEGLRLTRHYSGSTVCAPSRAVLMSGIHTGKSRLRTNWDQPLPDELPTIASVLKTAGYRTGCFGKWGIGYTIPDDDPNKKGFDEFFGYVDMFHAHNLFPPFLVRNGERIPLRNEVLPGSDKGRGLGNGVAVDPIDYAPDLIVDAALDFIDKNRESRFFLYLALNTPHANNEGQGYDRGMEVPDFGPFADMDWPDPEKGFARMMQDIDRDVGRIVEKLRLHGIARDTLIIFSSDNGPHNEGGHLESFFESSGVLRGRKRDMYEGGVRVPTIAWWPGKIAGGDVTDHLSGFQDYMPTFCELAGIPAPEGDGRSFASLVTGEASQPVPHPYLYWEFYEGGGKQAVVDKKWKAVRLNWIKDPGGPIELYDLEEDVEESHNVASRHPEIVDRMRRRMDQQHTEHLGFTRFPDGLKTPTPGQK